MRDLQPAYVFVSFQAGEDHAHECAARCPFNNMERCIGVGCAVYMREKDSSLAGFCGLTKGSAGVHVQSLPEYIIEEVTR